MKKNRGDEPIGVIVHIYMEISQRNFFTSNKQIVVFSFFLCPLQNWRTRGQNRSCWGVEEVSISGT
jgi:hypothetical protein